jgi:hypothetical protein
MFVVALLREALGEGEVNSPQFLNALEGSHSQCGGDFYDKNLPM